MKLIITKDYDEMSKVAADILAQQISSKPNSILGLATGGTPEGLYANLIKANKEGKITFKDIQSFNLDEYINLPVDHELSYRSYMNSNLFNKVDIDVKRTHVPNGIGNIEENAKAYDALIAKSGGIDLQLLGLGVNAHIGFNEPGSAEDAGTSNVALTETTIKANSRYFDSENDVPKRAITMGIGSILKAKKIVLVASGENKAKAIYDTFQAPISRDVPSSFLRNHNDVTIIVDEAAASMLPANLK